MNVAAPATWTPAHARGRSWFITPVVLLGGSAATAAAAIAGNGNVLVALAPFILVASLCVIWFVPIRLTLLAVMFLSLALDATDEGPWSSPLAPFGHLLATNLNKSIVPIPLPIPGVALLLGLLLVILIHRNLSGSRTDTAGRGETAKPLFGALALSCAAVLALCALGASRGGDLQMAKIQVQTFLLVLLVGYLSAASLRGMRDYRILGAIIVAAACIKSVYAVYVVQTVVPPFELSNGKLAYATTHGDSLLFACAVVMLVARFAERPVGRHALWCVLLLPLLAAGMVANNRRLVWVEIAVGLVVFWLISRRTLLKRYFARAVLLSLPLIAAYVVVGWNSQSGVFAPVKVFRSVGDSEVDNSTLYRDLENYNLLSTMRVNPFLGTGFGHQFNEVVILPDISFFKEYKYMPHNSVLGLWAFTGPFGFTAISMALLVGVYFAARSYRAARSPDERLAAFMTIATVLIYAIQCWGDIGFSERKSIFLVGPALAIAGQLACSTGAWRARAAQQQA